MFSKAVKLAADGIPTNIRGEIWKALVGNPLCITRSLFEVYKAQAKAQGESISTSVVTEAGAKIGKYHSFALIERDMFRTFDELQFLHGDARYRSDLRNILEAFVLYRCVQRA